MTEWNLSILFVPAFVHITIEIWLILFEGSKVTDSRKLAAPSFTFGQKHRFATETLGEGPAKYNITGLGNKGKDTPPASSLQSRPKAMSKFSTPAPGEYNVERATKTINQTAPKYTFGQKLATEKLDSTPGKWTYCASWLLDKLMVLVNIIIVVVWVG